MFQVKSVAQYAPPTEEQYAVVKSVYEATGILTVKDEVTGHWVKPKARAGGVAWKTPYQGGTKYGNILQNAPARVDAGARSMPGGYVPGGVPPEAGGFVGDTYRVRATYVRWVGSKNLPKGVVCAGYEVWTRDDFFDDASDYHCVRFDFDVWREEETQLHAYATGGVYVSDEMWKTKQREAELRRDHQSVTQMDPVGAVAGTIGPAIAQGIAQAMPDIIAAVNGRGLPPDVLAEMEDLRRENAALRGKVAAK